MARSAVRRGAPVPSIRVPPRITTSCSGIGSPLPTGGPYCCRLRQPARHRHAVNQYTDLAAKLAFATTNWVVPRPTDGLAVIWSPRERVAVRESRSNQYTERDRRRAAMELRYLGRSGIRVSALTLGTMSFGSMGNTDRDE